MSHASAVINLDEFRKRRESKPAAARPMPTMGYWSPVWVWVMVWPA
ncbi:MAG TPA: hypothetical protein VF664_08420 [Cystobacter sp.]|jgi:hypothetical protein